MNSLIEKMTGFKDENIDTQFEKLQDEINFFNLIEKDQKIVD